ncbi:MAG: Gfo/Idh/MocA family oxidoreductase [Alphaproteobacteria bacterium]|nr:Gfo/Idh/MocA family oxidoreductase [Alphaproteobacteria bacterium]
MSFGVGFIGLGGMARLMMERMVDHPQFTPVSGWDPSDHAIALAHERFGGLHLHESPAYVAADPKVDVVYISSPPAYHALHVRNALEQKKAVFCEKPLGVDLDDSRALVEEVEASGLPAVVNFNFASFPIARLLRQSLEEGTLGEVYGVSIHLHLEQWPRAFQKSARWLEGRAQGGFSREVLSHYVYLSTLLFGPGKLKTATALFPDTDYAEDTVMALVEHGDKTVTIEGLVGGRGTEGTFYTVYGTEKSIRYHSTTDKIEGNRGAGWFPISLPEAEPDQAGFREQLDRLAMKLKGGEPVLPSFRDGLHVQEVIEGILAS